MWQCRARPTRRRIPSLNGIFDIEERAVGSRTTFTSSMTRHLYEWWAGANGGRVPRKRQFDIVDHVQIIANVYLVQLMSDGEFEFKLHGENVICMLGENHTVRG